MDFKLEAPFLDFVTVWHKSLIFEFSQNGISGNVLNILPNVLIDRKEALVLNE